MKINKDSLSARVNNISKQKNVPADILYSRYFFDCFLSRLSKSPFSKNFILKGGLYLSSILGIDNRSTKDIDFVIKELSIQRDSLIKVIQTICSLKTDDNVIFKYICDEPIRKEDIYGGFSITLEGKLENVRQKFDIDIGVGDPIFPSEVNYSYKCLFDNEILNIKCYSIETVVSEKLQTVLMRGVFNSRSKDFYDLYILERMKINDDNKDSLKEAFKKTCEHRNFIIDKTTCFNTLDEISSSGILKQRWEAFIKKKKYPSEVLYSDTINSIKQLLNIVLN